MNQFAFCGGGIVVLHNSHFTKAIIVDLVNMKSFETTYEFIKQN